MSSTPSRLSDSTPSHIWGLRTERTNVDRRKTSAVDVDTLAMEPIIARLTVEFKSQYIYHKRIRFMDEHAYH
jgi:hypothetical protein